MKILLSTGNKKLTAQMGSAGFEMAVSERFYAQGEMISEFGVFSL
ncbi:hypothetical protein LX24_00350 [Desulfallas thermosapovorans DSM 6562]|uniref:Uncharacterized protein n=1 Tax=Desulfallas thermosapovorans DSM 6562 TaxID=1121431 RepID=A0A5S4ZYX7_9FIRM|nr:hypothetical protein LX24_00350 [Desulfallas thermosapovorans DSM 6562]